MNKKIDIKLTDKEKELLLRSLKLKNQYNKKSLIEKMFFKIR